MPRFTARHGAFAAVAPDAAAAVIAAPAATAAREVKGGEVCCCVGAAATARNGVASRTSADWRERRVSSCVVSSGRVLSALPQGGRPALRTEPMLDLEVVPERSLGNEQWEFTLGECGVLSRPYLLAPASLRPLPLLVSAPDAAASAALRLFVPSGLSVPGFRTRLFRQSWVKQCPRLGLQQGPS